MESQDRDQKQWIVEQYKELLQQHESEHAKWRAVKAKFMDKFKESIKDVDKDAEQVWKQLSGKALEDVITEEFSRQLALKESVEQGLLVQRWSVNLPDIVRQILSETLWARGELMEPFLAESNVDFIVVELENNRPIRVLAVYSCKASLRERFQQDMFWAERLRSRGIRFCLITLDIDGTLDKIIQKGQEGLSRNKQGRMAIAFYDRIYLPNQTIEHFKRVFRPIHALVEDLERWRQADLG